jgi:uncharacterized membrane protein YkvA (DUF1232 family)
MDAREVYGALVPLLGREDVVHDRFWTKVRRTFSKVPFTDRAVAAYYAAVDPATPMRVKAVLLAALAYFIMPADLIPDVIAGLGYTDDATVLFTVMHALAPYVTDDHLVRARAFLDKPTP